MMASMMVTPTAHPSRAQLRRVVRVLALLLILAGVALQTSVAQGQSYSFSIEQEIVDVFWESDGSSRILYALTFVNDPSGAPIEFIDIGTPNEYYDLESITATIDGKPIHHIAPSEYIDVGIELGLGNAAIQPGQRSLVVVHIGRVERVLYPDSEGDEYASAVFSPTWFDGSLVHGTTDLTVRFHLPPGVQPDEPRWHASPRGWPESQPTPSLDSQGRVQYAWHNPQADASRQYLFGASFPASYVPAEAIQTQASIRIDEGLIFGLCCVGGTLGILAGVIALAAYANRRRKLDYLPPKISIEGHGIKRGLTAVEAAVLLETPLDKVLTMILFSIVKKGAARVVKEDPLTLERLPNGGELRDYEKEFLEVLIDGPKNKRRSGLQAMMVRLVKSVQRKMKGFSLKETRDYYRNIMLKAWQQVEEAETPEVKSERFAEAIEWTMLDRDFDDRTRRVFRTGPVYVPSWWWHARPSTPAGRPAPTSAAPSGSGSRTVTLPTLPGADFAASVVNGVQQTASGLVSNLVGFTNGVTRKTNPPPAPSRSFGSGRSSGGGCACACACACAGCACACAGGGR